MMTGSAAAFVLLLASATTPMGNDATVDGERTEIVVSPGIREATRAAHDRVGAHLEALEGPTRRIEARALGLAPSSLDGPLLLVVGPIGDQELVRLLAADGLGEPLSKEVGDMRYARLYFGEPGKAPCCLRERTFSRESGEWKLVFEYTYSH